MKPEMPPASEDEVRFLSPYSHCVNSYVLGTATAAGSKTYILRSVLDPVVIEFAALTHEPILEEEAMDQSDDDFDDPLYGSIIAWSHADQLGPVGLLHVILALILVSGRVMNECTYGSLPT